MKNISRHLPHYLTLFGVFGAGILAFVLFSYDKVFQFGVSIALSAAYVAWGVVHHYVHRDLHLAVVVEYLVVAILGLVIVFSLLFRS
ncbi:hypothetical protein HY045_00735 [Candidatus Woesebacteria bacterium]|nr:hypothetical protein [Candidatus Woesebacteria bacterium]